MYQFSRAGLAIHLLLLAIAIAFLIGAIYEIKATKRSIDRNALWRETECKSRSIFCGKDNDTYVVHCRLDAYYFPSLDDTTEITAVNFTTEEFDESLSNSEIMSTYQTNNTFTCYYDSEDFHDVTFAAPIISIDFLVYEYLFAGSISIIIGLILRYWVYLTYENHFVPAQGWRVAVENIWERKNKENLQYPFGSLVFIELAFATVIFMALAFANLSSLNHLYGFCPIIIFATFGSFEKYPNPNFFLTPSAKINYVIANYAVSYGWSITNIFSRIVLAARDPFPYLGTYLTSMLFFTLYLAAKIWHFKVATNLFRTYFSNATVEDTKKN